MPERIKLIIILCGTVILASVLWLVSPSSEPPRSPLLFPPHVLTINDESDYGVLAVGDRAPFRRGFAVTDQKELDRLLFEARGTDGRNLSERILMDLPVSERERNQVIRCLQFNPEFNELEFTLTGIPAGKFVQVKVEVPDIWAHFAYAHRIDIWKRVRFEPYVRRAEEGQSYAFCRLADGTYKGSLYNFVPFPASRADVPRGLPVTEQEIRRDRIDSYFRSK